MSFPGSRKGSVPVQNKPGSSLGGLYSLERLSAAGTWIHRRHPMTKLLATAVYLVCVVSLPRYALFRMAPYALYPILVMAAAEIPFSMIAARAAVALPFCLFAGLSNLLFDREILFRLGSLAVSGGVVSLLAILLRTYLCVGAVLILAAITPLTELTGQLRRMRLPDLLVSLFEMTYRYLGALLEEASTMFTAYRLRSPKGKGVEMGHMGSFAGQLLIRSFDRAERVYQAMKCRGYPQGDLPRGRHSLTGGDIVFLLVSCGSSILFRLVDVPFLLGRWF